MSDQIIVRNHGRESIEVKLKINGREDTAVINPGRVRLPVGAELLTESPFLTEVEQDRSLKNAKREELGNSDSLPEKVDNTDDTQEKTPPVKTTKSKVQK